MSFPHVLFPAGLAGDQVDDGGVGAGDRGHIEVLFVRHGAAKTGPLNQPGAGDTRSSSTPLQPLHKIEKF